MEDTHNLGELEQLILLAILRLGDDAYGVSIRAELEDRAARTISPGAMYTALERLEIKRLISSRMGEPTAERGGRAKRYVTLTASGLRALQRARLSYDRMTDGLDFPRGKHA